MEKLKLLVEQISSLKKPEEVNKLIYKILIEFEKLNNKNLKTICTLNSISIDPIFDSLNNEQFINCLGSLLKHKTEDESFDIENYITEKQTVKLFLRLPFFILSFLFPHLSENTISFIKRIFSSSLNHTYKALIKRGFKTTKNDVLTLLESINYEKEFFAKNSNENILNIHLHLSMIISGKLLIRGIGYSVLPTIFNETTLSGKGPGNLFKITTFLNNKLINYLNQTTFLLQFLPNEDRDNLMCNLLLVGDRNIEDTLFLMSEISLKADRSLQGDWTRLSKLEKITNSTLIKQKVQKRFETLDFFVGDSENVNTRPWSNKVFLNTIGFLSVLESIKEAKNEEWKLDVIGHFLSEYIKQVGLIISYSLSEDSSPVVVYVEGESDKIILETAYKKLHPNRRKIVFYSTGGKMELSKKISAVQVDDLGEICFAIFDFDEAFNDFNGLKKFENIKGEDATCLYRIRQEKENKICAMLLPVPEYRKHLASSKFKENSRLSIELLFEDEILKLKNNFSIDKVPGGEIPIFQGEKNEFARRTDEFDKEIFDNFKPIFNLINEQLESSS